jgi:hypothetical protein
MRFVKLALAFLFFAAAPLAAEERYNYARDVRPLLQKYCFDCHYNGEESEGGVNLERFHDEASVLRDREIWKSAFDKVESHQMPPPKESALPTDDERKRMLAWIADVAARPDPQLGARDPGKPILRRITRLEYNNMVRDLLKLDTDVFMFPERLPLADKSYFQPATGKLDSPLTVKVREYGAKYPVLLPASGLPGDNRAEHGYRNRGDVMNISPLLLEKYIALAGEIVYHPDLPRRSPVFAELLRIDPSTIAASSQPVATPDAGVIAAMDRFAPKATMINGAARNPISLEAFREQIASTFAEGRGGVFDVPASLKNQTIAGKGGLIRSAFGRKQLTVNPNADLWLVDFATAEETSGSWLIANKAKQEKVYELTFDIRGGDEDEGIMRLGICVLGRQGQTGEVTLTVALDDGTAESRSALIADGPAGTTFFVFDAGPGRSIRRVKIDGSKFSGDYVLIDDLGFVTNGRKTSSQAVAKPHAEERQTAPAEVRTTRERLANFMARAFRRPAAEDEVDRYFSLVESAKQSGSSDHDALRVAAQGILSSPHFLYVAEEIAPRHLEGTPRDDDVLAAVRPLNDYELANRLSYFLWSSMPDDELLALAKAGKLREETTLRQQALRMLRDPKARELSESFAVQWLRLDQLYTAKPDADLFRQFYAGAQGKETLHASQLVEALLLFETVLIEDRSILDFIDADYAWLNPRLAQLYQIEFDETESAEDDPAAGMPNRELNQTNNNVWRRVPLRDTTRGGYLTMSGPLTVTSLPFRTSPVKRGAWLLETIFHRPPTEPKVAFAIENDTEEAASTQSIRAKFELHRSQAACYSCHVRLDPPGFALERFDAIGAWRDQDAGQPVDARGEWNGAAFDGPAEFKALLRRDPHEFTRGFIEHLLSYALARQLEIYDLPTVAQIAQSARDDGYRFQRLVQEIVASYPFRHTRLDQSLPD